MVGSQSFLIDYTENGFNCWPFQTGIVNTAPCDSHGSQPQLSCFVLHLCVWDAAESLWSREDTEHGESKQESQDSRQGRAEAVHNSTEPASDLCSLVSIGKIHIKALASPWVKPLRRIMKSHIWREGTVEEQLAEYPRLTLSHL